MTSTTPDHVPLKSGAENPTPWIAASELQPHQGVYAQQPIDEVDEMLMESFPFSDPPCLRRSRPSEPAALLT